MDIKDFCIKNNIDYNLRFQGKQSNELFYSLLIDSLGYKDILKYIPYSLMEIKKAIKKDEYLNNLPMKKWDEMSGIETRPNVHLNHKGLYFIYKKHNINSYDQATGVCILKQCARLALTREGIINE